MPTCADVQLRVRHKPVTLTGTEVPEPLLRGMCGALATLVLDPSEALSRIASSDPTAMAGRGELLASVVQRFDEELARLEEACVGVQEEARARGLRGVALEAWCVTRLNTEFMGHPRRRRVKTPH
jgi:hypothetical protein